MIILTQNDLIFKSILYIIDKYFKDNNTITKYYEDINFNITKKPSKSSNNSSVDSSENIVSDSSDNPITDSSENIVVDSSDNTVVDSSDNVIVDSSDNTIVDSSDNFIIDSSDNTIVDSSENIITDTSDNIIDGSNNEYAYCKLVLHQPDYTDERVYQVLEYSLSVNNNTDYIIIYDSFYGRNITIKKGDIVSISLLVDNVWVLVYKF